MLQQIVIHTPFHVWLLLAFLVWRGIAASRDRVVPLRQVFVLPAILLALSVHDMAGRFAFAGLPAAGWLAGTLAAAMLAWHCTVPMPLPVPMQPERTAGSSTATVMLRGSWLPLVLMLATFATKYTVAVVCIIKPALPDAPLFATAVCTLYGVFNGLFAGRALRCLPWPGRRHIGALS